MKKIWHTLTTPEEWHPGSLVAVGLMFLWTFAVLLGENL